MNEVTKNKKDIKLVRGAFKGRGVAGLQLP
jgi:hypothetical protein